MLTRVEPGVQRGQPISGGRRSAASCAADGVEAAAVPGRAALALAADALAGPGALEFLAAFQAGADAALLGLRRLFLAQGVRLHDWYPMADSRVDLYIGVNRQKFKGKRP